MIQSAWLFAGLVAILATTGALATTDDGMAIVLGVAGTGGWGVTGYGALDLELVSNGTEFSFTSPTIALLCFGVSLIPLYIALTGPINIVRRATTARPEDL